ncbi:hypothetical protein LPJ57_008201 [Coemansia sp. RSA 486]|nr:hypothetical protein LPJ57_008201 [Coemansia sp. RSA 486]
MAVYLTIRSLCHQVLYIGKALVWVVLTFVRVFATLIRIVVRLFIIVAVGLFEGVFGAPRSVASAIAAQVHKLLAWKTDDVVEKRRTVSSTLALVPSANAVWQMATPAMLKVFLVAVPGAMMFIVNNAISIIELPRTAAAAHDYVRFTVVGWVNPMGFVGIFPAVTTIRRLSFYTSDAANAARLTLGMVATAGGVVERREQAVGGALTEILLATLAVPARSQATFSAATSVIRMARKPTTVQDVGPAMAAVAPRPLLVECPVFFAAVGLANSLAFELPITIDTATLPVSVTTAFIGPAKPSAELPDSPADGLIISCAEGTDSSDQDRMAYIFQRYPVEDVCKLFCSKLITDVLALSGVELDKLFLQIAGSDDVTDKGIEEVLGYWP